MGIYLLPVKLIKFSAVFDRGLIEAAPPIATVPKSSSFSAVFDRGLIEARRSTART